MLYFFFQEICNSFCLRREKKKSGSLTKNKTSDIWFSQPDALHASEH